MTEQHFNDAMLEIDQGIIKDFFDEFNDMYELTVTAIEELEKPTEHNASLINSVFRGVHSIKSNLRMVGLISLSTVVHHLENLLEQVRHGQCQYMPEYGDIIRLILDETRISAEKYFNKEPITGEFEYISNAIEHICQNIENRKEAVDIALKLLDPLNKGKPDQLKDLSEQMVNTTTKQPSTTNNAYEYVADDLNFFKQIFISIDKRIQAAPGKLELINKLALKMNELSGFKVDQIQLQVAIYLYNWGLSLLPIDLINKKEMPNDQEIDIIKKCPFLSVTLLQNLPFWQPAAKIIDQCHERPDGLGYPNKLNKEQICDGAKILAIADAFGAIFYAKPYQRRNTRSVMAAILTINNEVGVQFDEYWADLFNQSIKYLHQEQQLLRT